MPPVVVGALLAGAAAAGAAYAAGVIVTLTAALTYGAVVAGLSLLSSLLLRPQGLSVGTSRGEIKNTIRAAVIPRRHAMGRVKGGGFLIFLQEDGSDLHMAMVLSDGPCDAIEKIYTDGTGDANTEVSFTEEVIPDVDGGGRKLSGSGDYKDRITIYEYFKADGTQGKALQDAVGSSWDASAKVNGRSWLYIKLNQPDFGNDVDDMFFSKFPNLTFVFRGKKITWPGQSSPAWTRNPACWRYWHDTVRMQRPASVIDLPSFHAAKAVCDQTVTLNLPQSYKDEDWETTVKRYSVDGWLIEDAEPGAVEEEINAAWAGSVVSFGGKLFYRPGVDPSVAAVINGDEVILERYAFLPEPSLNQRVNALTGKIAQSSQHDWTEYVLPEIQDASAIARDGRKYTQDFGTRELIADPIVAARNTTIILRKNQAALVASYLISPGPSLEYLSLKPGDVIDWTDSYYGIKNVRFIINEIGFLPDWSLRITIQLWPSGVYADSLDLPPLPNLLGPGQNLPTPGGFTLDEIALTQPDGSLLIVLEAYWNPQGVYRTQVRWREQGNTSWERVITQDPRVRLFPVEIGKTYEAQVRFQWGGGHYSEWTPETPKTRTIQGDLTPPAKPTGLTAKALPAGYELTWDAPTEKDYGETLLEDRVQGAGTNYAERLRVSGTYANRFGLLPERNYEVRIRHLDKSRNQSAYSDVVTIKTGKREAGPPGTPGPRTRGDFYRAIQGSAWSTSEANAATPGDNVISDTVTLYQAGGGYIESRTWNGSTWIAFDRRFDGGILFPGTVTANALAARSVRLGSGTVDGKLKVGNIESNVRTARILYKRTGNGTVISPRSNGVFSLAQAFGDFDFLLFVVVNRPGTTHAIYGSFQISTDIIPSSNTLTGEIGWVGGSSVHDNIGAKIWGSGSSLTLRNLDAGTSFGVQQIVGFRNPFD